MANSISLTCSSNQGRGLALNVSTKMTTSQSLEADVSVPSRLFMFRAHNVILDEIAQATLIDEANQQLVFMAVLTQIG